MTSAAPNVIARGVMTPKSDTTPILVRLAKLELLIGGPYGEHPYGHTALRVSVSGDDRVYDYGRYGRTWGVGKSEGEGVLNIWSSFASYIEEENSLGRLTVGYAYDVTEEQAQRANQFYQTRIAGKKPRSSTAHTTSYVIDDYYALGPNCTTLSVSAAKTALPDLDKARAAFQNGEGLSLMEKGLVRARGWPDHLFMPADLKAMLDAAFASKPSYVKRYGAKK